MGLGLEGIVDHLIDVGPYDQPPTADTEDGSPRPPAEEDTEDEDSVRENRLMGEELGTNVLSRRTLGRHL